MKLTEDWLRAHLHSKADINEIIAKLTAIGLEVESVKDLGAQLAAFVIAEVTAVAPHPNADRLRLCDVNYGAKETLQVVCGADNVRLGMRSVFAPAGSYIPGTGLQLKAGDIRGVTSHGMLCSERELMISDAHDGIIDLPPEAPIGTAYAQWSGLSTAVIEINVTPNRGDCLSMLGIARDLAAAGIGTLKAPTITEAKSRFAAPMGWVIDSKLAPQACPFVMGRSFRHVKNTESPAWMQQRLKAIGLRPISALVDITNYVTFDLGRPLHVFDADKLTGDNLIMRGARKGETLLALDGKEYKLTEGMTVIADDKAVQSIAGIMGGDHSGCQKNTQNVFLEAALFSAQKTAATGRALGIESDARYRFERGLDPQFVGQGIAIASQLILDICGGEAGDIVSAGKIPQNKRPIALPLHRLKDFAAMDISETQAENILKNLGFTTEIQKHRLIATPPSWRTDIEGAHCLIEEILRIYGYDKVPAVSLPHPTIAKQATDKKQNRCQNIAQSLALNGYFETISWSFTSETLTHMFNHQQTETITLSNPISSQLTHMRPSVLANLAAIAAKNNDRGFNDIALFEIGPAFLGREPDRQILNVAGIRCGNANKPNPHTKQRPVDAFDIKADVLDALRACRAPIENLTTEQSEIPKYYHPGKAASLKLGAYTIAHFGELHPQCAQKIGLTENTAIFEIYLDRLPPLKDKASHTRPPFKPSTLQAVTRDFAFILNDGIAAEKLIIAIRTADKKYITDVALFDVYRDDSMENSRSLAVRVTLQSYDKTLTDADIEQISRKIIANAEKKTNAKLRHTDEHN